MPNKNEIKILSLREQVLKRPAVYIGAIGKQRFDNVVVPTTSGSSTCVTADVSPALLKIVDEIVSNALDASIDDALAKTIKIEFLGNGEWEIYSTTSFPITWNADGNDYSISLAFGRLLTSSNYDDDVKNFKAGQNGIGAKATNIFSKWFIVEVNDPTTGLRFIGQWRENMSILHHSSVSKSNAKQQFVRINFLPDYTRFDAAPPFSDAERKLFSLRAFDASLTAPPKTNVFFNGVKLVATSTLRGYVKSLVGSDEKISIDAVDKIGADAIPLFEVAVALAPADTVLDDDDDASSAAAPCQRATSIVFVNGTRTIGGTIHDFIFRQVSAVLSKKVAAKPSLLKSILVVVARASIPNPRFTSQNKDVLDTKVSDFGFRWSPSDTFSRSLVKATSSVLAEIKQKEKERDDEKAKKAIGKAVNDGVARRPFIPKYEHGNLARAGKPALPGQECSLILTEGDSAKGFAMAGRVALGAAGSNTLGVFPLKGVPINARKSLKTVLANEEVDKILRITGLSFKAKYTPEVVNSLPYQNIVILSDQDSDGAHISGLVVLLAYHLFPTLAKAAPTFFKRFATPIVKIVGPKSSPHVGKGFFTTIEFETFLAQHEQQGGGPLETRFLKGLGSSTNSDAKAAFLDWDRHVVSIRHTGAGSAEALSLAFDETRADDRKKFLLETHDPASFIDYSKSEITIEDLVRVEVARFWIDDLRRSIPDAIDGFKESQRKILHTSLSSPSLSLSVARFASTVAVKTSYHHGEVSLTGAITKLASTFVGSGNVSLMVPSGQFGTRAQLGKDAASPRYVFTQLDPVSLALFPPADAAVLDYEFDDDKKKIEPVRFVPVIPLALLNGAKGIATGWSSECPSYAATDLLDVCDAAAAAAAGGAGVASIFTAGGRAASLASRLVPSAAGWTGDFVPTEGGFFAIGKWSLSPNGKELHVTELPLGKATDDWETSVRTPMKKPPKDRVDPSTIVRDITKKNGADSVDMTLHLSEAVSEKDVAKTFNLATKISTSNMHFFDASGRVRRFDLAGVFEAHAAERLALYTKSRAYQIASAESEMALRDAKIRFVLLVVNDEVKPGKLSSDDMNEALESRGFAKIEGSFKYLTSIPLSQLSTDNVAKMRREMDELASKIEVMKALTPSSMWQKDLSSARAALAEYAIRRAKIVNGDEGGAGDAKHKKKKQKK